MKKKTYLKMSLDVDKVSLNVKPVIFRVEKVYPEDDNVWFDCYDAKSLRICLFSDILVKVNILWSFDRVNHCMTTPLQSTSIYRSMKSDVLSRYFRVQILNESGKENKEIFMDVRSFGGTPQAFNMVSYQLPVQEEKEEQPSSPKKRKHVTMREPLEDLPPILKEEPEASPSPSIENKKSPFNIFKKKGQGVKDVPVKDKRLPDLLFSGGLLFVDKHRNIKCLPVGEVGQILKLDENKMPQWVWEYPPKQMSEESTKKLSETFFKN